MGYELSVKLGPISQKHFKAEMIVKKNPFYDPSEVYEVFSKSITTKVT